MNLIEHNLLTLDFWQDHVTYEGKSMPTGTLACAALNLPEEVIAKLSQLCMPLNLYMGALQLGQAGMGQLEPARDAAFQIVELLRDTPPFSILDYGYVKSKVDAVFTEDYLQNAADFAKSGSLAGAVSPEYQKAMTLLALHDLFDTMDDCSSGCKKRVHRVQSGCNSSFYCFKLKGSGCKTGAGWGGSSS